MSGLLLVVLCLFVSLSVSDAQQSCGPFPFEVIADSSRSNPIFNSAAKYATREWSRRDPEGFESFKGFLWWVLKRIIVAVIAVLGLGVLAEDRKLRPNFWRGGVPALIGLFSPAIGLIAIVVMGGIILAHDPQKP